MLSKDAAPTELSTPRLKLRDKVKGDADPFFDLVNDPTAAEFQTWDLPDEREAYRKLFEASLADEQEHCPVPLFETTQLHVEAASDVALGSETPSMSV